MPINCVICFRDDNGSYYINAYVTLLSIFKNTREKLLVHILHDETIQHGKAHLEELCQSYGHEVQFHKVPILDPHAAEIVSQRFNLGATYLYYLHEFVTADKAIYLDCDVIVNRNILDLYEISIDEYLFASTLDSINYWKDGKVRKKYKKTVQFLGLCPDTYISSGLLLINVKKLRQISQQRNLFVEKTLAAVKKNIPLPHPDMDILNSIACTVPNSVRIIDARFNLWKAALHLSIDELENTIFHYVAEPDHMLYPAHLLFWKYYAMSPFAGNMFERMSAAYTHKDMDFVRMYLTHSKHRQHSRDLLQSGVWRCIFNTLRRRLNVKTLTSG